MMRRARGFTLVELMVYCAILAVVGVSVLGVVLAIGRTQSMSVSYPGTQAAAQDAVSTMAAMIRRSPTCETSAGCTRTADAAIQSATSTSVAVLTSSAGAMATFTNTNGALIETPSSGTAVTLVPDSLTIRYKYLVSSLLTYNLTTDPNLLTWSDTVATSSLKSIIAVRITATVVKDGVSHVQTTVVRLRNSPKKFFITG